MKRKFYYLLIDQHTDGVLWSTQSKDAATAMSMYSTRIKLATIDSQRDRPDAANQDFATTKFTDMTRHYRVTFRKTQRTLHDMTDPPAGWLELRQEIARRGRFQTRLSNMCDLAMMAMAESGRLQNFMPTVDSELAKCDPAAGRYSLAIEAYAATTGCTAATAYGELKMQSDNLAHARLRNLGIYLKYRDRLNEAQGTTAAQAAVMQQASDELFANALV